MKTLEHWIEKKHVRYMPDDIQAELKAKVPQCKGDAAEALFWVLHGLTEYPSCEGCGSRLTSFHWEPFLKPELRKSPEIKQGYRPFCGKSCAYRFGTKQESYRKTSLERWGVEHPMKSQLVIEKIKITNLAKYGDAAPNRWAGDKFTQGLVEKYGVEAVRHIPGVSLKIAETKLKKTAELLPKKIKEMEKLFEVECTSDTTVLPTTAISDIELHWKHKCGREYISNISFRGIRMCPSCSAGSSRGELQVLKFVEELGLTAVSRDRTVIAPKELDIWLPERRLAIEFDGTYWHSAKFESRSKSMEKLELCEKAGVQLITLQEHLWVHKPEHVLSRLRSILGKNETIDGRKTKVITLEQAASSRFLWDNHLQGPAKASVHLGLQHDGKLVAVATFGRPRWAKKHDWELIRMSFKSGVTVVGGAAKLIKAFRRDHTGSMVSYADRCWSTGNVYKQLGFRFSHVTQPSYWWCHHSLGTYARYQTQKQKLEKLLTGLGKEFDPVLSEDDNMTRAGFLPIYDRGNSVWVLD